MELFVIIAIVVALGLLWSMNSRSKQVATLEAARFVAEERERQDRAKAEDRAEAERFKADCRARCQVTLALQQERWETYVAIRREIEKMSREQYERSCYHNSHCNPKVFREEAEGKNWSFYIANREFYAFLRAHTVDFMECVNGAPLSTFEVLLSDRETKALALVSSPGELADYLTMMATLHSENVEVVGCLDEHREDGSRVFARPPHVLSV